MEEMFDMMENGPPASFNDRFGGYDPMDPNSVPQNMAPPIPPEVLERFMLQNQPKQMDDSQISADRFGGISLDDFRSRQIDPEVGPKMQFADPGFGPSLRARNPNVDFDETMDMNEMPTDQVTKQGMQRYDDAERLVQEMIHKNLNNRKFR